MNVGKIVIIEDDAAIRRIVALALKTSGYADIYEEADGQSGLDTVFREHPDLVLLDIMVPGMSGYEICRRIRSNPETASTAIIMLTAKSEDCDIVAGLDCGANDYVTKPFSKEVLLARIRAMLRDRAAAASKNYHIELDGLVIDDESHSVELNGAPLALTLSEYRIIELLVRNRNHVFTRSHIIDRISDEQKTVTDRTVDVQMVNLRRKLGVWASHIETIRGVGYRVY